MAKDTDKLIRQLSLISFLMAVRRPVRAAEIRRDVEGYSEMNEDAFARRFYADRSELDSLGIELHVERPLDASAHQQAEQETYSLPAESFHLPAIAFDDRELAGLRTALTLLDGEFAYAEPLRLALQQLSWGRPSPLNAPDQRLVALAITGSAGGHELSQRLAKVETAIFRRKTITFDYYTIERDDLGSRRVDPYHLLYQGGQFYLLGWAHERGAMRVFRLSRLRGRVAYATKSEHDFARPGDFDPRAYANRVDWQFGEPVGEAEIGIAERIAWQIERHFGPYGILRDVRPGEGDPGDRVFTTPYANARQLIAWVLGLGEHARILAPAGLRSELDERLALLRARHTGEPELAGEVPPKRAPAAGGERRDAERERSAIRPERFGRLVTLAAMLISAGRGGDRPAAGEVCRALNIAPDELREDIDVLNVVNFGGGTYVLYAEVAADGRIDVDPDAYSDHFDRPARLLPVEAKALVFAIDLLGEHLPEGSLRSARAKIVAALGEDPVQEGLQVATRAGDDSQIAAVAAEAIAAQRLIALDYYKPNEDERSSRVVEPYGLINGREGWYLASFDPSRDGVRHFRLDRIRDVAVLDETFTPRAEMDIAADVEGWPRTGRVPASRIARVWISPERARWAREERPIVCELADGAVVAELSFAGTDWLVREVLKEAGDAVVLEPADARAAVREAAERLASAQPHAVR